MRNTAIGTRQRAEEILIIFEEIRSKFDEAMVAHGAVDGGAMKDVGRLVAIDAAEHADVFERQIDALHECLNQADGPIATEQQADEQVAQSVLHDIEQAVSLIKTTLHAQVTRVAGVCFRVDVETKRGSGWGWGWGGCWIYGAGGVLG